jgi:putative ABC transport system permease protein
VRQALGLILAGVVLGGAAALALGSVLRSLLFDVSPRDPATLAAIAAGLACVAIVASAVPALRATRVDPLVALRAE